VVNALAVRVVVEILIRQPLSTSDRSVLEKGSVMVAAKGHQWLDNKEAKGTKQLESGAFKAN